MPRALSGSGSRQATEDAQRYEDAPQDYVSGLRRFSFKRTIYSAQGVKNALLMAQNGKCCYCESAFRHGYAGAVEHLRPRSSVRQGRTDPRESPGYYWLAYSWSNLLFICGACNDAKSDLFPLSNPQNRVRNHQTDLTTENPLLVDPSLVDPRTHIRFRLDAPYAISEQGRASIEVVRLDRSPLAEERRQSLDMLQRTLEVVRLSERQPANDELAALAARARGFLNKAVDPESRFSSMAADFLGSEGYVVGP